MVTCVTIDNVFSREEGARKVKRLEELTKYDYRNLSYGACPVGGSFDIVVTSMHQFESDDPEKELMQHMCYVLGAKI